MCIGFSFVVYAYKKKDTPSPYFFFLPIDWNVDMVVDYFYLCGTGQYSKDDRATRYKSLALRLLSSQTSPELSLSSHVREEKNLNFT